MKEDWLKHWKNVRTQALNGSLETPRVVRRMAEEILEEWKIREKAWNAVFRRNRKA